MAKLQPQQTRQCSTSALKTIYYVIIGLAIIEALQRAFLIEETLLGSKMFALENFPSIILLLALLPTICRFVLGASIHFDMLAEKRYKPLFDSIAFFTQAALFYLMAVSLDRPSIFSLFFVIMLLSDAFWLVYLWGRDYIEWGRTETQWLVSDIRIIGALTVIYIIDKSMARVYSLVLILVIAVGATILDFLLNKDFYFPTGDGVTSAEAFIKLLVRKGIITEEELLEEIKKVKNKKGVRLG